MLFRMFAVLIFAAGLIFKSHAAGCAEHVVLVVWDGMRPDFVTPELTPTLCGLRSNGTWFARHHSAYPTSTEVNGAVLATGAYPGRNGILANNEFRPAIRAKMPVGTQELDVVRAGDKLSGGKYLAVPTLAELVQGAGHRTAIAGSKAVVVLHDRAQRTDASASSVLMGDDALPASLWPVLTNRFGIPPASVSPNTPRDEWTTRVLTGALWEQGVPKFSLLWLSEPDVTQHKHAPGTKQAREAIRGSDKNLALVLRELERRNLRDKTDIIVVSDHGFSTISANCDVGGALKRAGLRVSRSFETPPSEGDIMMVINGGSVMFYVTGRTPEIIRRAVAALQTEPGAGVVFTRDGLTGTFKLREAGIEAPHSPDIVVSFDWKRGELDTPGLLTREGVAGGPVGVGMHTSLSPFDTHNICIASGPDFRAGYSSDIASGNVDVMPTMAWVLGIKTKKTDGRVLKEALIGENSKAPRIKQKKLEAKTDLPGGEWSQYLSVTEVNGVRYLNEGNGEFVRVAK